MRMSSTGSEHLVPYKWHCCQEVVKLLRDGTMAEDLEVTGGSLVVLLPCAAACSVSFVHVKV